MVTRDTPCWALETILSSLGLILRLQASGRVIDGARAEVGSCCMLLVTTCLSSLTRTLVEYIILLAPPFQMLTGECHMQT